MLLDIFSVHRPPNRLSSKGSRYSVTDLTSTKFSGTQSPTPGNMCSPYAKTLHTSRLSLTQADLSSEIEIAILHSLLAGGFAPYVSKSRPYTHDFIRRYFNNIIATHEASAPEGIFAAYYIVRLRSPDATPIGVIMNFVRQTGFPLEFAFILADEYQRKGYGTEAVTAVLEELQRVGVTDIGAVTNKGNEGSQRLLSKSGLVHKGSVMMRARGRENGTATEMLGFVMPYMKGFDGEEAFTYVGVPDDKE